MFMVALPGLFGKGRPGKTRGGVMRRHSLAVSAAGLFFLLGFAATPIVAQNGPCTSSSSVCVTTWQQDTYRTGQNLQEPTLIATGGNLGTFGELCSAQLDGQVYGQPLV